MAKRRKGNRFLAGLGEGIGDASALLLRSSLQDKQFDRMDERQRVANEAIAKRQEEAATRASVLKLIESLGDDADPAQVAAQIELLTQQDIDPAELEGMRPSTRRRLGKRFNEPLEKATSPEAVPTEEDLLSFARGDAGLRIPGALDEMSGDPFGVFRPEVRETSERFGARRKALREKPELIDYEDPITGEKGKRSISRYDPALAAGMSLGPTAEQAGALKGMGRRAELDVAGDAEVAQGAKVAGANRAATQSVEMAPAAVAARTREAVNKEVATLRATLPMQLKLAQQKAAMEIQTAVNKEDATQKATSIRASGDLAPFFDRVAELTKTLNDEESGLAARAQGAITTVQSYMGDAPALQELNQLIAQNARKLAIAMGVREANVSEKETAQALKGIGLDQWSTTTERQNALRNLRDVITLSPAVASRLGAEAGIGERMQLGQSLMRQRRLVEEQAIALGADVYRDPVTLQLIPVIRK